jgi:hypothetical protein
LEHAQHLANACCQNVQMPPKFRTRTTSASVAATPERLFDDLPRATSAPKALWSHQADILRNYHDDHLATADVALELPTGAGKTLPGLLVAEWRRRSMGHRVIYACPTQQLSRQTAEAAEDIGIATVTLVGRHRTWPTSEKVKYESARALAVTTYSTVFNSHPALEPAQTLLFDDAHAAEGFVADMWSIDVRRFQREQLYLDVLEALRPAMSGVRYQMLRDGEEVARRSVQLVSVAHVRHLAPAVMAAFDALTRDDKLFWPVEALGERLDRCQVYVAWDRILIRPFIPPTGSHRHFTEAAQRIYLSATLGEGGELERSFGRTGIVRVPIPEGWDTRGAGRRFFVFPDLQSRVPARDFAAQVVAEAGKALVLAPSKSKALAASDLAPQRTPVYGPDGQLEDLLAQFRPAGRALLTLGNRYDGLDLPDAQCRVTVLDGLPSGAHLQERFLSETLLSGRVLRERLRTRVVQGAGRCTRGLSDHSVVVVVGDALTRFLNLPEVHHALRPEMQAELDFGLENAEAEPAEQLEFVRSFLAQDQYWREQAEPVLLEARKNARRVSPPENAELAAAARLEVRAAAALWNGDWAAASRFAQEASGAINSPKLAGYRALWLYFAAAWLAVDAEDRGDESATDAARNLLRRAHAVARGTSWLRQVEPLPAGDVALDELDMAAVARAAGSGLRQLTATKWVEMHTGMLAALSQAEARAYERALVALGSLLGAESYKPLGEGRTDAAWVWPSWWLAVEAKTEEHADAPVSLTTVRQANDQLKTLAHDREEPAPDGSAVLVVGDRQLVDRTAAVVAEPFLHLAGPEAVLLLAQDAVRAWKSIRAQGAGLSDEQIVGLVGRVLEEHAVLPSDVRERLLAEPIQG